MPVDRKLVFTAVVSACTLKNGILLHFTFDDHFNDVTCHKAIATKYGSGTAAIVWDKERNSMVAMFDGNSYLEVRSTTLATSGGTSNVSFSFSISCHFNWLLNRLLW